MTTPAQGWYPDPADGRMVRWWSGAGWTEHTRPHPDQPQPPAFQVPAQQQPAYQQPAYPQPAYQQPYPQRPGQPVYTREPAARITRGEKDRQVRSNNPMAYIGLVFSLVAFIFNLFAIPSILGIVFSAIGVARSADLSGSVHYTGRVTSIFGLVLGVAALGVSSWHLLALFF